MILCAVSVSRQDKCAGVSLYHWAVLVVQDVLDQAARCLLNVSIFLREGINEVTAIEIM